MNQKQTVQILRIFEILWLVIAGISIVEVVGAISQGHWIRVITFGIFAFLGIFMFFFRRKIRRSKQQSDK